MENGRKPKWPSAAEYPTIRMIRMFFETQGEVAKGLTSEKDSECYYGYLIGMKMMNIMLAGI